MGSRMGRCFKAVDPVSEGKAKFIAIDEQPNYQVVHLFRLRKAEDVSKLWICYPLGVRENHQHA